MRDASLPVQDLDDRAAKISQGHDTTSQVSLSDLILWFVTSHIPLSLPQTRGESENLRYGRGETAVREVSAWIHQTRLENLRDSL